LASPAAGQFQLWKTDGTTAGTVQVTAAGNVHNVAPLYHRGLLYFARTDPATGPELWTSDGTTATPLDVIAGSGGLDPTNLAAGPGGLVYFSGNDPVAGRELWKTDGTVGGTVLVRDVWPGPNPNSSSPAELTMFQGYLYFVAGVAPGGGFPCFFPKRQLWRTDGTTAGTTSVVDVDQCGHTLPVHLTVAANRLFFVGHLTATGSEPWVTDGTNTNLLRDIAPGFASSIGTTVTGTRFVEAAGTVFFAAAASSAQGQELWKTDGSTAGTVLVKDIHQQGWGSDPSNFIRLGDLLLFMAFPGPDEPYDRFLFKSDGTDAGTVQLSPTITTFYGSLFASPASARAVFAGGPSDSQGDLARTDGTAAGTVVHQEIRPGFSGSYPNRFVQWGSKIIFRADDGTNGIEPWVMDTMAAGTPYGSGCPGTGGLVPAISAVGTPLLGNAAFGVRVSDALPAAAAYLGMGFLPLDLPLGGGCRLYFFPPPFPLLFGAVVNGSGVGTVTLAIPGDPLLNGIPLYFQYAVVDPMGAYSGLAFTGGLRVVLGAN
jgi:ELWxxDGT repeat protein